VIRQLFYLSPRNLVIKITGRLVTNTYVAYHPPEEEPGDLRKNEKRSRKRVQPHWLSLLQNPGYDDGHDDEICHCATIIGNIRRDDGKKREKEMYRAGHMLVITKRGIFLRLSGGFTTPPMAVDTPSATSSEI